MPYKKQSGKKGGGKFSSLAKAVKQTGSLVKSAATSPKTKTALRKTGKLAIRAGKSDVASEFGKAVGKVALEKAPEVGTVVGEVAVGKVLRTVSPRTPAQVPAQVPTVTAQDPTSPTTVAQKGTVPVHQNSTQVPQGSPTTATGGAKRKKQAPVSEALKKRCRKYNVKLTTASGKKRSKETLTRMCQTAAAKKRKS